MTWEIVVGLIALIGFFITVTTPIMKLNTSIVQLKDSIETLQKAMDKMDIENEKSHKRIWEHNDEQDETLAEHERRLTSIEHTMDIAEKLHPELLGAKTNESK